MNRKVVNLLKTAAIAVMLTLCFSMAVFADNGDTSRFPDNTDVNGIQVGGLTVEEATAKIQNSYAENYKITVLEKGGKKEEIRGAEIGFTAVITGSLQEILNGQNNTGRESGPGTGNSYTVGVQTSYSVDALNARIASLQCISGSDIVTTSDAHISAFEPGKPFTIIPEVYGNNVDAQKVGDAVRAAAIYGVSEVNLEQAGCYYGVKVRKDDAQLKELCSTMNGYTDMTITYTFGEETAVLDGGGIASMIEGTSDGQVLVSREKAAAYIAALAAQYDTAGKERAFHTATGRDVVLTGPYGWKMNQSFETDALIVMIMAGQSQTREPAYTQSAVSRIAPDWGNTYVEVDLTGQHVYMTQNGAVIWDAPCVTGNISAGHTTPPGIYTLKSKERDRVLRGPKLANGKYSYESPVKYWMPFNGGIGLHDANWRGKFGGTIYQYSGSHGCVNLPPSTVPTLFELVYVGIPVICYN